jgi:hypothetical protein
MSKPNAKVTTVQGSIPASSDTVESEGRQIKYLKYIMEHSLTHRRTELVKYIMHIKYTFPDKEMIFFHYKTCKFLA